MRSYRALLSSVSATVLLALAVGHAEAAPLEGWTNFYLSVFGGGATSSATIGTTITQDPYDPEDGITTTQMLSSLENGLYGGLAFGASFAPGLRGEVEISNAHLDTATTWTQSSWEQDPEWVLTSRDGSSTGTFDATFALANIWFDIPTESGFTPYVGGGVGIAHLHGSFVAQPTSGSETGTYQVDVDAIGPAVQVGAGVKIQMTQNIALDLGYRYKVTTGPATSLSGTEANNPDMSDTQFTSTDKAIGVSVFQVGFTVGF